MTTATPYVTAEQAADLTKQSAELLDVIAATTEFSIRYVNLSSPLQRRERQIEQLGKQYAESLRNAEADKRALAWFEYVHKTLDLQRITSLGALVDVDEKRHSITVTVPAVGDTTWQPRIGQICATQSYTVYHSGSWHGTTTTGKFIEVDLASEKKRRYTHKAEKNNTWPDKIMDLFVDAVKAHFATIERNKSKAEEKKSQLQQAQAALGKVVTLEETEKGYYADSYRHKGYRTYTEITGAVGGTHDAKISLASGADKDGLYRMTLTASKLSPKKIQELLAVLNS